MNCFQSKPLFKVSLTGIHPKEKRKTRFSKSVVQVCYISHMPKNIFQNTQVYLLYTYFNIYFAPTISVEKYHHYCDQRLPWVLDSIFYFPFPMFYKAFIAAKKNMVMWHHATVVSKLSCNCCVDTQFILSAMLFICEWP